MEELLARTYEERTTCWRIKHTGPCWPAERTIWKISQKDRLDALWRRIFKINVSDTDSTSWGDCVPDLRAGALRLRAASLSSLPERPRCWALPPLPLLQMRARSRPLTRTTEPSGAMKTAGVVFDVQGIRPMPTG